MSLLPKLSLKAELHRRETIKRFDDFLASYLARIESVEANARDLRRVSVVARSPESPVAAVLMRHAERLVRANCDVRAVFANIEPATELVAFFDMLGLCHGENGAHEAIRWAKKPGLLDAHEQLVLGSSHCWTGDAMRRSPDVRFALDIFNATGGGSVSLGAMAFDGLWSASTTVPRSRFRALPAARGTDPVMVQFDGLRDGMLDMMPAAMTRH